MSRLRSNDTAVGQAILASIAILLLVTAAGSAWAHHGWSEYDANKRATLTGTVRELHFGNPHVTLLLETPDKVWNVMLASPARLKSRGVTEDMLATGKEITVEGLPHKTKQDEFRAERMTLGGMTVELR
jgi:Family of unknown function (DUF6152)